MSQYHIPTTENPKLMAKNLTDELKQHLSHLQNATYRDLGASQRADRTIANLVEQISELEAACSSK